VNYDANAEHSDKPSLSLTRTFTAENLAARYKRLTGNGTSPEEMGRLRRKMEEARARRNTAK
jgi:hypothetical protein